MDNHVGQRRGPSLAEPLLVCLALLLILGGGIALLLAVSGAIDAGSSPDGTSTASRTSPGRDLTDSPYWKEATSYCDSPAVAAAFDVSRDECIATYIAIAENP